MRRFTAFILFLAAFLAPVMLSAQTLSSSEVHLDPDTVEQNISEIAYICGYSDSLYFSRVFKKNFGCSPKNYAAMHSAGA